MNVRTNVDCHKISDFHIPNTYFGINTIKNTNFYLVTVSTLYIFAVRDGYLRTKVPKYLYKYMTCLKPEVISNI